MSDRPALRLQNVVRTFHQGDRDLEILRGVDFAIEAGEVVALLGPSGAGKSTLLHIAGLLEPANGGEVYINGVAARGLEDRMRTRLRSAELGFVYQFHHLLAEFSALENVAVPQVIAGVPRGEAEQKARELLSRLGLGERLEHRPARLSGGEQQRVAIARALANNPSIVLADEPTGNLDERTSERVFDYLVELIRDFGVAALIATHNTQLAARMDRKLLLHEGRIEVD